MERLLNSFKIVIFVINSFSFPQSILVYFCSSYCQKQKIIIRGNDWALEHEDPGVNVLDAPVGELKFMDRWVRA
jgi:hypothetical protein